MDRDAVADNVGICLCRRYRCNCGIIVVCDPPYRYIVGCFAVVVCDDRIECDIVSALGAFDNPSLYTVENVKILEGVDLPITEVVSFTHTYAGEVIDKEHVIAKGKVEKVIVNGETSNYRLVVGTTREAIDEYLKLKKPPI